MNLTDLILDLQVLDMYLYLLLINANSMTIPTCIFALSVTSDMLYNLSLLYYLLGHDETANLLTTGLNANISTCLCYEYQL